MQPKSVASYSGQMQARGARTMPIIPGTNETIHEESRKHLEYLGVDIPKFMAYAIFVIEYQHHKATADYMARANSGLKGETATATEAGPSAEGGPPGDPRCLPPGRPRLPAPIQKRKNNHPQVALHRQNPPASEISDARFRNLLWYEEASGWVWCWMRRRRC